MILDPLAIAVRFIITVCIVWLAQVILAEFSIQEPARKIIFAVVLILAVLFLFFGPSTVPVIR